MAWRPHPDLIDGELSNRVPGKVTGWMRFFRMGKQPWVVFDSAQASSHECHVEPVIFTNWGNCADVCGAVSCVPARPRRRSLMVCDQTRRQAVTGSSPR